VVTVKCVAVEGVIAVEGVVTVGVPTVYKI